MAAQKTGYPYDSTDYYPENMSLSVINQPDQRGGAAACDFQPYSFYLGGKRTYWGLPNNPNYDLGPLAGSPATRSKPHSRNRRSTPALSVYYHSAWESIVVNASKLEGEPGSLCPTSPARYWSRVRHFALRLFKQEHRPAQPGGGDLLCDGGDGREKLTGKVILQSY